MWFELGTRILSSLLSLIGVGIPALDVGAAAPVPATSCATAAAETCLDSDVCDVFIAADGEERCGVACDMRDATSCQSDGQCALVDGACDYTDYSPVGC